MLYALNMEDQKKFHTVDYIIFVTTLVASMAIGLFFGFYKKKNFTSMDYFFGGKKLRAVPVAFSFVVTFQSSLLILGFPAETYGYGMKFSLETIGIFIAFILGAFISVPVFRPLKITSIYKYFNLRYGSNEVRFLAATAGIIYLVFYMAIVVLGTCLALNSALKIPFWATVITYTVVTTIYTSIGGFKAVIWTDVFQLLVMVTGILATLIKSVKESGGPSKVYSLAEKRFDVADFRLDPTLRYTFWMTTFGPITQFLIMFFTQAGLQRIKSTPTARSTYIVFVLSGPIYCIFAMFCFFEGVSIFAYYSSTGCDPLASGKIRNINEIVPYAVLDLFGTMPGFPGLFIASLSSATLSTLSSCLTGLSSITFEDIIKLRFPNISDKKATKWSKIVVLIYGAISMGLTFLMSLVPGSVTVIFKAFMGSIDGPTCGIFILSIIFLRSTTRGVMMGAISGMVASITLNLGQRFISITSLAYLPLGPTDKCFVSHLNDSVLISNATNAMTTEDYYVSSIVTQSAMNVTTTIDTTDTTLFQKIFGISFMLFSLIGFLVTVIVGVIASILTEPTAKEKIDTMTLYPLPDRICSLFPDGYFYSKASKKMAKIKMYEENVELMERENRQSS